MMQKDLHQLIHDKWTKEAASLDFSCDQISLVLTPGTVCEGAFTVYGSSSGIRGFVVSTDSRMECLTKEFSGQEDVISYRFCGTYLEAGEEVAGEFHLITNAGEYALPFRVHMEAEMLRSSLGEVRSLADFAALARSDWEEAGRLFYSAEFERLLKGNDRKYTDLYRGLSGRVGNQHNLEEFLIACGKKQPVSYRIREEELSCENPADTPKLALTIYKEGWGYSRLKVSVEGDFIYCEKEVITDDDFLGNQCVLPIYVDSSLLHQGRNFGCIRLSCVGVALTIPVNVLVGEAHGHFQAARLEKERLFVEIMDCYQLYRLQKIAGSTWLEKTGRLVEQLVAMNDKDIAARLFQAQILINQERFHEASWVLTHVMELMEKQGETEPALKAYYLYLTTLVNRDREYIRQVTAQVEDLYRRNRTSWKVAWFLLYLSPEYYRYDATRWAFLEKQFKYGCTSPVWYMETLLTLHNNPALLRRLGEYEIQVLHYGARKESLSEELKEQFLYLAGRSRDFSPVLLRLLILCYRKKEDERVLQEICSQLIKGGRTDKEAHVWYALGVEKELRITRLYEYYMMSMDLGADPAVSKKALLYFSWQTNMDYEHTAYLYYYVLSHRKEHEELAGQYQERMEHFVVDQILKEHINRHLAYLYQELLTPAMFSEQLARSLSRLLFAHMITVEGGNVSAILVYRPDIARMYRYPAANGCGWVPLYSEKDTVLLEDTEGNRYAAGLPFRKEKLMDPAPFVDTVALFITPEKQSELEFDKYLWDRSRKQSAITPDLVKRGNRLIQSSEVSSFVKGRTQMRLLYHYQEKDDERGLDNWLEQVDWEVLDKSSRREVLKSLVRQGKMEKAREWLARFGPEGIETGTLVQLCNWMIGQNEETEEQFVTGAAAYTFRQGKYDGVILAYLGSYFRGFLGELEAIYKAAVSFEAETKGVCERILWQSLFTGVHTDNQMEIFKNYLARGADEGIASAFLERCAYEYLAEEKKQDAFIFREMIRMHQRGERVQDMGKLAVLKYFAQNGTVEKEKAVAADFLRDMMAAGIRLNFFRQLTGCAELLKPLADKTIVECPALPGTKVTVHYVIRQEDGEASAPKSEEMIMAPGGIYFKEFVLFYGESLQYYFTKEQDRQKEITQSYLIRKDETQMSQAGRFGMINEILMKGYMDEFEAMDEELEDFYHKEYLGRRLFTMR